MRKGNFQYVIGVDGGGTKTVAALADLKGKIIAKAKSGSSNPRNVGLKKAVSNIVLALKPFLKKIKRGKIFTTIIALPAVEEEFGEKKKEILRLLRAKKEISKIFQGKIKIISDQEASFRAGTNKKDGVVLISGTGCVAHGWRENKEAKASGWGWLADEGSAFWVGQRVIQAILKDLDKRGKKTILSELVFQKFEIKNINDFLRKVYSKSLTEIIPQFSILCDKASKKGDIVAKEIMKEAARELALSAKTVIQELNFQKEKFPFILTGSMFKSKIVLSEIQKRIRKFTPRVKFIKLKKESAVRGVVRLAIEMR